MLTGRMKAPRCSCRSLLIAPSACRWGASWADDLASRFGNKTAPAQDASDRERRQVSAGQAGLTEGRGGLVVVGGPQAPRTRVVLQSQSVGQAQMQPYQWPRTPPSRTAVATTPG